MTTVFVKQPLALSGSAKHILNQITGRSYHLYVRISLPFFQFNFFILFIYLDGLSAIFVGPDREIKLGMGAFTVAPSKLL